MHPETIITTIEIIKIAITPKSSTCPLLPRALSLLPAASPCPQATTELLSVSIDLLAFSRILYKWTHVLCTPFCLPSFTRHIYFEIR